MSDKKEDEEPTMPNHAASFWLRRASHHMYHANFDAAFEAFNTANDYMQLCKKHYKVKV